MDKIKYIEIKGPLMVFGGPYSNLHALQALRAVAESKGYAPNQIICTGDIVAYCAFPQECISFIADWGIHCIAGNVELNIKNDVDDCGCNFEDGTRCDLFSKQWFPYAKENITNEGVEFISQLPEYLKFEYAGKKIGVLHGSFQNTSEFIFKSTAAKIKRAILEDFDVDVVIGGHCGLPFIDHYEDKMWLNPGVIGMPANDGDVRTWYAEINNELEYSFERLEYDFENAHDAMLSKGLVPSYAKTLKSGIWDNCDILPVVETMMQGKLITI